MSFPHKNKTFATLLASLLGTVGAHRFYLNGRRDRWGWLHLAAALVSLSALFAQDVQWTALPALPAVVSMIVGFIAALVLGLMPDDKWDARYNADSGKRSRSDWKLALLLVLTLGIGATVLIGAIARGFDLLFTGGAYG